MWTLFPGRECRPGEHLASLCQFVHFKCTLEPKFSSFFRPLWSLSEWRTFLGGILTLNCLTFCKICLLLLFLLYPSLLSLCSPNFFVTVDQLIMCLRLACSIQKFPGKGSNPSHISDNAKSLTTRLPGNSSGFPFNLLLSQNCGVFSDRKLQSHHLLPASAQHPIPSLPALGLSIY